LIRQLTTQKVKATEAEGFPVTVGYLDSKALSLETLQLLFDWEQC